MKSQTNRSKGAPKPIDARPEIINWAEKSLAPQVPKEFSHLVSSVNVPQRVSFELHNVSSAYSNALRRVVCLELPVKHLSTTCDDIVCDDVFVVPEMIVSRVLMIPISQSTQADQTYSLVAANLNNVARSSPVYCSAIKNSRGESVAACENIVLLRLQPGKKIEIKNMKIETSISTEEKKGGCVLASGVASVALDVQPLGYDKKSGVSCSVSDPQQWQISFDTNGTETPKNIVRSACENIIARTKTSAESFLQMNQQGDTYTSAVAGESYTVGYLLMRAIYQTSTGCVVAIQADHLRGITEMRLRTNDDPAAVMNRAVKRIVETFSQIAAQI